MDTKELFSKFNSRDYSNQLETILENKDFSVDVKNLLLSMLYKIEIGYKDYATVKRMTVDKRTYIEEIIDIIDKKCEKIIIVQENSPEEKELKEAESKFLVNKLENTIYLRYPNETIMLYTLYKLNNRQVYFDEKYNLVRNSLSNLLNAGEDINKVEVVRDFNGWNWNSLNSDIPEIATNLIYQNLIYLLGISFLTEWIHSEKIVDYVELAKKNLEKKYGKENADELLNEIYKISIIICTMKNEQEKRRLLDEKENLQKDLAKLQDKHSLLNEISVIKKDALKKIKEIDNILNDKNLLKEEYEKRNAKRAEYNKILNLTHLTEILEKERKKELNLIENNNRLLDPKNYVEIVENIEKDLYLLKDIGNEENELKYLISLQNVFLKCFRIKIKNAVEREEIIDLLYMLRYYNLIYVTENLQVKDMQELKENLKNIENDLIKKANELKVLNTITTEESVNDEIIKSILKTKIISLENTQIELISNGTVLNVNIYDGDVFEKTITIPTFSKDKITVKFGKAVKIFN